MNYSKFFESNLEPSSTASLYTDVPCVLALSPVAACRGPPSRHSPKGNHQKKNGKKAVRLTAWVDPPLPRSGQENVKISRQVVIFGVILPFYNGQNGPKFSQNRSGQAGGR